MADWIRILRSAAVSGSCAGLGATAALAIAARAEGKSAIRPINATSHWLHGDAAGTCEGIDGTHTAVGFLTNQLASVFWAVFFEAWRARQGPVGSLPMLRDALVMSVVAAAVDYGATPRRFTPGWELVLSRRGMAVAYAGLAIGLGAGSMLVQPSRHPGGPMPSGSAQGFRRDRS